MGPNARSVLGALKRIDPLEINLVATGHGPLLRHHRQDWLERYRTWSETQAKAEPFVALFYLEDYGFSDRLGQAIAQGITKTGTAVELVNVAEADPHEVRELVHQAAGLVVGMPPQEENSRLHPVLSTILAAANRKQGIGLFEAGGGHDEPIYPLRNRFQELGLTEVFAPILVKEAPAAATDKLCEEAGTDLGQWLSRDRQEKKVHLEASLDQSLGRISSGLYLLTTRRGEVTGAMVASWVIQASFQPLGVAIAVAKDRAIESLLQVGDTFVLNILQEGNYYRLVKHFLKRFAPGTDRFAGIATYEASNGSPILAEALAYLECTIQDQVGAGDHQLIYARVNHGQLLAQEGVTAIQHRKSGSQY